MVLCVCMDATEKLPSKLPHLTHTHSHKQTHTIVISMYVRSIFEKWEESLLQSEKTSLQVEPHMKIVNSILVSWKLGLSCEQSSHCSRYVRFKPTAWQSGELGSHLARMSSCDRRDTWSHLHTLQDAITCSKRPENQHGQGSNGDT